jgi:hypothetical protein
MNTYSYFGEGLPFSEIPIDITSEKSVDVLIENGWCGAIQIETFPTNCKFV